MAAPKKTIKKEKIKYCSASGCKRPAVVKGYCRLCYLSHWKSIKENQEEKAEGRLSALVDRIAGKYGPESLEVLKLGLEDEAGFKKTLDEIDAETGVESSETEREFLEKFLRTYKDE
jgi:hypothetical protein